MRATQQRAQPKRERRTGHLDRAWPGPCPGASQQVAEERDSAACTLWAQRHEHSRLQDRVIARVLESALHRHGSYRRVGAVM